MEFDKNDPGEQMMSLAETVQAQWRLTLDLLDGQVAEAMRHGWSEPQARSLVYALNMRGLLGGSAE